MNQPAREYMRGRCLEEAAMLRDGKPCLSIPVTPIELLSLLDEADDRDRLLADLAKAREELEALKAEYQCAECQAVTRERDEARSGSEAYSRLLATSEKALGETAAQLAALEARAADALLAEAVVDDDVASEAQMMARLTWHDRVRRYLSAIDAGRARAT